jgi:flagellar biogenesis protein FliO
MISIGTSLIIVVGLFVGLAMLYRKTTGNALGKSLPKNVVQVLGRTSVSPRQQLLLLRFGPKLVLVSMVQGETRTISEVTDPLEVDRLSGFCESARAGSISHSFRDVLAGGGKA